MVKGHWYVFRGLVALNPVTKKSTGLLRQLRWEGDRFFPARIEIGPHRNCANVLFVSEPYEEYIDVSNIDAGLSDAMTLGTYRRWQDEVALPKSGHALYRADLAAVEARIYESRDKLLSSIIGLNSIFFGPDIEPPKKTIVYIAGRFSKRETFRKYRASLEIQGYEVRCRWLDQVRDAESHEIEKIMQRDIEDIDASDVVIVDGELSSKGGMLFEMGYAYAKGKRVYLIGDLAMGFAKLIPYNDPERRFKDWLTLLAQALPSGKVQL